MEAKKVTDNVTSFTAASELPTLGALAVNAFFIDGPEPMLVDTGVTPEAGELLAALRNVVDPADIRWIWLSHADRDHTGALTELLELAPNARVISTFITLGLMGTGNQPIPPERALLVRGGSRVRVGGRDLVTLRPPLFDNPGTAGFFDPESRLLFTSDFFGAVLPSLDDVVADDVGALTPGDVADGQRLWGSVDAPWVHSVDERKLATALEEIRRLDADLVLSSHLPPIRGGVEQHLATIATLPASPPTILPDQEALEAAMAVIGHGAPA